jgi:hypothetical protein
MRGLPSCRSGRSGPTAGAFVQPCASRVDALNARHHGVRPTCPTCPPFSGVSSLLTQDSSRRSRYCRRTFTKASLQPILIFGWTGWTGWTEAEKSSTSAVHPPPPALDEGGPISPRGPMPTVELLAPGNSRTLNSSAGWCPVPTRTQKRRCPPAAVASLSNR